MKREAKKNEEFQQKSPAEALERVVEVNRCAKVVKGGRRFSFSALVVVGDRNGQVGYALGKARENADAIRKATEAARRNMVKVTMLDRTIPHEVIGRYGASRVMLRPATKGTGVIAGGGARAVLDLAGIRDVLAKSLGSGSALNVVKATMNGLQQLRSREETAALRQ
ncbi:MAG TPA: 30S ribosomal protein S5 [Kiritimatiellia bacterium]|nr:30S ribosomal protein S5 [Kiritimatiellia bacterium]MBP9572103.1 30S ribosomal protein S5 [Kiritimatiellia bacterium]HOE00350.1 30S ribosomal protein S5 [Kiritimatiellia bacterium]HOE36829.1 30S ribosomal protein S5 [Kiritimatiellia bacterium]HOR73379.1 30S ribosomal protein S5 [Kiritimatiellia bacterium]